MAEDKKDSQPDGVIIYCDGGYQQQYRTGGWGIHGYTYKKEEPKRGTGNPKAVPLEDGYKNDNTKGEPVTIVNYIDGRGGVPDAVSNNHTELVAMNRALSWIEKSGISTAKIYTDSQYVVRGIEGWVDKWKKNGWTNSQGAPVASKSLWEETDLIYKRIDTKIKLDIKWIKGHAGHIGNETADRYATAGNILGRKNITDDKITEKEATGYWNRKVDINPMLCGTRWYFQTTDENYKTADGEFIYYQGNHGDDDTMHGKPVTDTTHSVVIIKEHNPVLELIRETAIAADKPKHGPIIVGNFQNIFNPAAYGSLMTMGSDLLDVATGRIDMRTITKSELVREQKPAWLSLLAVEELESLERKLVNYRNMETSGRTDFVLTDITDLIYDRGDKKGTVVVTLKPEITQSLKSITVDARYTTKLVKDIDGQNDPDIKTTQLKLILDGDTPKRNALNKFADVDTKVTLLTWRFSEEAFRYATVVETKYGIGIWAGVYSNLHIV